MVVKADRAERALRRLLRSIEEAGFVVEGGPEDSPQAVYVGREGLDEVWREGGVVDLFEGEEEEGCKDAG